jgi:hypothetical protein
MDSQMHKVDLRYTREELMAFFGIGSEECLNRGGRYDTPGSAISVWSHPWLNEATRLESTPLGGYYVRWGDENRIYQIECQEGFDLDDLLHELAILEEKALGHVKHGKRYFPH